MQPTLPGSPGTSFELFLQVHLSPQPVQVAHGHQHPSSSHENVALIRTTISRQIVPPQTLIG